MSESMTGLDLAMAEARQVKPKRVKRPKAVETVPLLSPEAIARIKGETTSPEEPAEVSNNKPEKEKKVAKVKLLVSVPGTTKIKTVKAKAKPNNYKKRKPSGMAASLVAVAKSKPKSKKGLKATRAQLQAAKTRKPRVDWTAIVESFKANKVNKNFHMEMGSAGSAQVTRVRLNEWEGFKGLVCFTVGPHLFISKLKIEEAREAARKFKL